MSGVIAFVRRCLDAGMPLEMALAAGEQLEAAPPEPTKAALRTRRWRAKAAQASQPSQTVTRDVCDDSDVTRQRDVSPEPPSEKYTPSPPKGGSVPSVDQPEKPVLLRGKPLSWWVSEIWSTSPERARRRSGRRSLETALGAAVRRGVDPVSICEGLSAYYASPDATEQGGRFAQGIHVAISSGRWEAFVGESGPDPPAEERDPWPRRLLGWRTNGYWNSEWGPKPGKLGYAGPDPTAEAA